MLKKVNLMLHLSRALVGLITIAIVGGAGAQLPRINWVSNGVFEIINSTSWSSQGFVAATGSPYDFSQFTYFLDASSAYPVSIFRESAFESGARGIEFSPTGTFWATQYEQYQSPPWVYVRLYPNGVQRLYTEGSAHAFSHGERLFAGGRNGVSLWRTSDWLLDRVLGNETANAVGFSADDHVLGAGLGNGAVQLWQVETGMPLNRFAAHTREVKSIAFSRDGRFLATCASDNHWKLWSADGSQNLLDITLSRVPRRVEFSPDSTKIVVDGGSVYSVPDGAVLGSPPGAGASFSPDGMHLSGGGADSITIARTSDFRIEHGLQYHEALDIATAHSGKFVVAVDERNFRVLNTLDGGLLSTTSPGSLLRGIAIDNSDGYASTITASTLNIWQLNPPTLLRAISTPTGVNKTAFGGIANYVIAGNQDGFARLYDFHTAAFVRSVVQGEPVTFIAPQTFDDLFATSGTGLNIRIWRASDGALVRSISNPSAISALAWSPVQNLLAVGSAGSINLWDIDTGTLVRTLQPVPGPASGLAFSPNGSKLLSTTNASAQIWRVEDGLLVKNYNEFTENSRDPGFGPYGTFFYLANCVVAARDPSFAGLFPPIRAWVATGVASGGGLFSLPERDGDVWEIRNGPGPNPTRAWIQAITEGLCPTDSPGSLSAVLWSKCSFEGFTQVLDCYNFRLGRYDRLDSRLTSTLYRETRVPLPNPTDYLEPITLQVRMKVSILASRLSQDATLFVDQAGWDVR